MNLRVITNDCQGTVHTLYIGDGPANAKWSRYGTGLLVDLLSLQTEAFPEKVLQPLHCFLFGGIHHRIGSADPSRGGCRGLVHQRMVDGKHLHLLGVTDVCAQTGNCAGVVVRPSNCRRGHAVGAGDGLNGVREFAVVGSGQRHRTGGLDRRPPGDGGVGVDISRCVAKCDGQLI